MRTPWRRSQSLGQLTRCRLGLWMRQSQAAHCALAPAPAQNTSDECTGTPVCIGHHRSPCRTGCQRVPFWTCTEALSQCQSTAQFAKPKGTPVLAIQFRRNPEKEGHYRSCLGAQCGEPIARLPSDRFLPRAQAWRRTPSWIYVCNTMASESKQGTRKCPRKGAPQYCTSPGCSTWRAHGARTH